MHRSLSEMYLHLLLLMVPLQYPKYIVDYYYNNLALIHSLHANTISITRRKSILKQVPLY